MKQIALFLLSTLIFFSFEVQASTVSATLRVTATIKCSCNVNGIIVPITEGACGSSCDKLKELNSTGNLLVSQNGNTKTIIY
jgi:hypothetical protein